MQENEKKEQEQPQEISQEMISEENISQEIPTEPADDAQQPQGLLNITFIPQYMDVFDGLCATDQADGTGKRARMLFVVLVLLMCVQLIGFFSTQNGFMFAFALLLGGVALFIKKKSQRFNREIAKAFEDEGEQHLVFEEDCFYLNDKQVSYDEVAHLYELKKVFSIIYQGNHVYILPKSVMDSQQTEQFVSLMQEKVSAVYDKRSKQ